MKDKNAEALQKGLKALKHLMPTFAGRLRHPGCGKFIFQKCSASKNSNIILEKRRPVTEPVWGRV
jgi:hypothetical protein